MDSLQGVFSNDMEDKYSKPSGTVPGELRLLGAGGRRDSSTSSFNIQKVTDAILQCEQDDENFVGFEDHLFDILGKDTGKVVIKKFRSDLKSMGLLEDDPRLMSLFKSLTKVENNLKKNKQDLILDKETFGKCIAGSLAILKKGFEGDLVLQNLHRFQQTIEQLYKNCIGNKEGKVADYIPELSRFSADNWGLSVCSVDGQRFSFGNCNVPFSMQACFKPLSYALAINEHGAKTVHEYVGMEPSGDHNDEIMLGPKNKPHNPIINAGALVIVSMIKSDMSISDRFDHIQTAFKNLCGGKHLNYSQSVYLSERQSAYRNFALAHYLKEKLCLYKGATVKETMDLYCQLCAVEVTCESLAIMAASLANAGMCPLTGQKVFSDESVCSTLAMMHSCGMYDYSGQFAFDVGLPAKSSVSGAVMLVIPNLLGMCLWSPARDSFGNSSRGIQFCHEMSKEFQFHQFDCLFRNFDHKRRPSGQQKHPVSFLQKEIFSLLYYAKQGALPKLRSFFLSGLDMKSTDYDSRTALHLAAAEGHLECVKFLLEICHVHPSPVDRWDHTPLSEAQLGNHVEVTEYLTEYIKQNPDFCRKTRRQPSSHNHTAPVPVDKVGNKEIPNPANGGTVDTPAIDGATDHPTKGGAVDPPAKGGAVDPPANGGAVDPPANGGAVDPPAKGDHHTKISDVDPPARTAAGDTQTKGGGGESMKSLQTSIGAPGAPDG